MKVLYIGHYRDGTGWGNAALNNILAMDSVGIDVVPRAITYEASDKCNKLDYLESKSKEGCDVVVQHTLPNNYVYNSNYKNIGYLAVESDNFRQTGWQHHCNLMDEIWVPSGVTASACVRSGVNTKIKVVPHSLDISKYKGKNKENGPIAEMRNNFTFGFVGEFIERKNIKALIHAFHLEFNPREPVNLFVKTSKRSLEEVQKYFQHIKNGMKIRPQYREEIIACGYMPEEDYIDTLAQIDCFVMPSRGEAFCIPSLEAMALGKPSIYTEGIGMNHCVGSWVESRFVPCFGAVETLPHLDTSWENWREIDVLDLAKKMRFHYNNHLQNTNGLLADEAISQAQKYSHQAIGEKIKEILHDS